MRVVLRADAGPLRGTGHVMRCITVARALADDGNDVVLLGEIDDVGWLTRYINDVEMEHVPCARDMLSVETLRSLGADRLVVDSYWIDVELIREANEFVPTMAIVDNDTRGITATWYLDQNLGAELRDWSDVSGHVLAGSRYALVRKEILKHRVEDGWKIPGRESHVVAFMGGTDPTRMMTAVAGSIAKALPELHLTAVTTAEQVDAIKATVAPMPHATVLGPTSRLPEVLGSADAIVSAAGTSSWDVCSMGRPAVLVGVVDNQSAGLAHTLAQGIALGVDATRHGADCVGALLARLLDDAALRETLVSRANEEFDGGGATRVARALTQ